jgi:DNA-binding NarL/FixJ family response regulator
MRTKILLVDDHRMFLESLTYVLANQPELEVSDRVENSNAAIQSLQNSLVDIALVDIDMPGMNGLVLVRQIHTQFPTVKTVILSSSIEPATIKSAVKAGVRGYVVKTSESRILIEALKTVIAGKTYLCPDAATVVAEDYQKQMGSVENNLSERECEILKRIAEGLSAKEIGAELNISSKTVDTHRLNIMAKLKLNSVAELTKEAIRLGLTGI